MVRRTAMIDLLIPVLGRPQNAQPVVDSIHQNTIVPHTIIFLCTHGDTQQIEACKQTGAIVHLVEPGRAEYARKINIGATLDYTNHPWLFLGADDLRFHSGWVEACKDAFMRSEGRRVIGTNDLCNPNVKRGLHATHSLVHRTYVDLGTIDEPGPKLLHEYDHNWIDNELIATAQHRGEWAFAKDAVVEHLHWVNRKTAKDATYLKGAASYRDDQREFMSRRPLWTS